MRRMSLELVGFKQPSENGDGGSDQCAVAFKDVQIPHTTGVVDREDLGEERAEHRFEICCGRGKRG